MMHFDDRLDTVLRSPAGSETIARVQFRQLVDLLGSLPDTAQSERVDAAYLRLGELAGLIPARERARILHEPALRLRAPRLVAQLAVAEPEVAVEAMARAELGEDQWLDLIPALPVGARGFVRHRRGLPQPVAALLARLGVTDRGLPPAPVPEGLAAEHEAPKAVPLTLVEPVEPPPQIDEIGAIVRRIEAFRKTRQETDGEAAGEASSAIGGAALRRPATFDFATDAEGRIAWADPAIAPAVVGLRIAARDPESPAQSAPELLAAVRHRQPIVRATIHIDGSPAIAGEWRIDAAPRFDQPGGRFAGYVGRMRRPAAGVAVAPADSEADRMRQILHELRTPVNAIQGFAEVIQQQLFGPTPHEYRALAATVAGDGARMLAAFEELERLVKLDSGAMALEPGHCDLLPLLTATVAQLESFNAPRRSGLELECEDAALPVALAPAEAQRLVWRLLATLAGTTSPGEVLRLRARMRGDGLRLTLRLPASLAFSDGDALFDAGAPAQPQALAAGMFGTGFALRLAAAEAKAAGGSLERRQDKLRLTLPATPEATAEAAAAAAGDGANADANVQ